MPVMLFPHILPADSADETTGRTGVALAVPRLFLDVDGVIAPMPKEPRHGAPVLWREGLGPGRMHFRVDVIQRLTSLHTRGVVKVEWLTSWDESAAEVLAPIVGLPAWPVNARRDAPAWWQVPYETDFWKERFVYVALEAGERVVWCDDDIQFRANHAELAPFADSLFAVSPSSAMGLSGEDLDAIEHWAVHGHTP